MSCVPFFRSWIVRVSLDCGSLLPLSVSAACCGENFPGEGQIETLQNSSAIHEQRP
jgi:hypothetical protein